MDCKTALFFASQAEEMLDLPTSTGSLHANVIIDEGPYSLAEVRSLRPKMQHAVDAEAQITT